MSAASCRALAAAGVVAVLGCSLSGSAVAAPVAHAAASPVVAPYVDTSLSGEYPTVYRAVRTQHLQEISAGFVMAQPGSCTPQWNDDGQSVSTDSAVTTMIRSVRHDGADVVVSFGGQAADGSGEDLAMTCTTASRLAAAYRSVVSTLGVTRLDFDVEGTAVTDHASVVRRFTAIHALEKANRHLVVSLTVPVLPSGLDPDAVALLHAAKHAKARLDLVNVMAMDYGGNQEMGKAATSAATHTLAQLRHVSPKATYRNIGITPMIGRNDVSTERFSLADARTVAGFARSHHVGRLAFWSLDRDQQCTTAQSAASYDCSGVSQSAFAYTHAFLG